MYVVKNRVVVQGGIHWEFSLVRKTSGNYIIQKSLSSGLKKTWRVDFNIHEAISQWENLAVENSQESEREFYEKMTKV